MQVISMRLCVFTRGSKSHVIQLKQKSQTTSVSKLIGLEACKQIGERKLFCRYAKIVHGKAWQFFYVAYFAHKTIQFLINTNYLFEIISRT